MKIIAQDSLLVRMFRVNATQTTVRPQKILPMAQQEGFGLCTWVVTLVCAVMACVLFYGALVVVP